VSVTPATFSSIHANQSVLVTVTIASPATTPPQIINNGTIQLWNSSAHGNAIAIPLPVTINIQWQKVNDPTTGIAVIVPPWLIPIYSSDQIAFIDAADLKDNLPPAFVMLVSPLIPGQTLYDFVVADGTADPGSIVPVTIGGRTWVRWYESTDIDEHSTQMATIVGTKVVIVSADSDAFFASPIFSEITSSLATAAP
jgi:hypothetical protein